MKFRLTPDDVIDSKTFAEYARQQIGAAKPTGSDWGGLNKQLKKFWKDNPDASWADLTRGVTEAKERGLIGRESSVAVLWFIESFINERSLAVEKPVEAIVTKIDDAMREEDDPEWRLRLAGATGSRREKVLREWRLHRGKFVVESTE